MNFVRKQVPFLSLLACTGLLWGAWQTAAIDVAPAPLAMKLPPRTDVRMIRVGVLPEPRRSITLEVSGAFRVRTVGTGKVLCEAPRSGRCSVTSTARGLKIGDREYPHSRLELVPEASPAVWVEEHLYRGQMRLIRQTDGSVLAVNVIPLEDYVASVIDSEMPATFPEEARKAQAIVARTYAVYQTQQAGPDALVDLYASTRSQKYLGFQYRDEAGRLLAGESADSRRIAAATRGQVCVHRNQVFCTYYCAVCGGSTVRGTDVFSDAAPPLRPVRCDWCRDARLYRWTADIPKRDVQTEIAPLLARDGAKPGALRAISLVKGKREDSLPEFELRTDRQTVRVSGTDLRQLLGGKGLYSPRFTVIDQGKGYLISGQGHGHGVGLCQWGARGLALAGKNCEQILQYYYAGAQITREK